MSRYRLAWYELEQQQSGDWLVKLPLCDVYSGIIDRAFPAFRHIGWRADTKGTGYTYFKSLAPDEVEQIERFLKFLEKHLLLCLNKNLESEFTDELDECYALDYNLRDSASYTRTDIGRMEYEAKYNQDEQCAKKLADTIAAILDIHPSLASVDFIVAVPGNSEKNFHLPDLLVSFIGKTLGRSTGFSLTKVKHTPQLKTLPVDEKLRILEGAFAMSKDVTGHSILLIDDLYQSGATMWTLARFLKEKGAAAVFGLACVKSWRDSDNV